MQKFNKGEWSEPYCVLKIISDKKLLLCNSSLAYSGTDIQIKAGTLSDSVSYKINKDETINFSFNNEIKTFEQSYIKSIIEDTLTELRKKQPRTFPIPVLEKFYETIGGPPIKSKSGNKEDCEIIVFDELLQTDENLKFSIKSFIANPPTLINASKATNFTYQIIGKKNIGEGLKAKTLVKKIKEEGLELKFINVDSDVYKNNLEYIDTQMPILISELLKIYYTSRLRSIPALVQELMKLNPLKFDNISLYKSKVSDFLFYSCTGIFPNTPWRGVQDVDGGCLIVKPDGNISTFYIFRKNFMCEFRDYLYNECFLDTAKTRRHGFGRLYQEDGSHFLKLNLQVRISEIKSFPDSAN